MNKYFFIVGLLFPLTSFTQIISGIVINDIGEPLSGANVYWLNTTLGTTTGHDGVFEITSESIANTKLIVSYVGYIADTMDITNQTHVEFKLSATKTLKEVVVKGQQDGIIISNLNPIKTEQITQTELKKAACCDLAGCFETQSTVQPQTTNVITNSKELRILGLSGVYNQILIDGLPMIRGLTYTYGISSIPGTLVENIYVSKGANSVIQGFESISGQINVETKEPDDTDQLLLNVYLNNFMEKHFNASYAFQKGKWSNLTAVHTVQAANRIDKDDDGFLDLPLLTRYMVFNKWKYGNDKNWGWNSRVGLRFVNEDRIGGQVFFDPENDEGSTNAYGQTVHINQPEMWTKTGYRFNDEHSISLFASAYIQDQNTYFGTVKYQAEQLSFYGNIQYELDYKHHNLKAGFSQRHLDLDENILFTENRLLRTYDGNYKLNENISGIFAENTFRLFNDKLTWIIGFRADHHNQFGFKYTPRTLLKYDIKPKTILRANIGTAWRTANLFSENIGLLVSSRNILFKEQLEPEEALNYGINITQKFETEDENLSGYFSADYYHTDFQNQIFPDYDTNPQLAIIENFRGTSISNGFQVEFFLKIWQRFELKTGYNYLDVFRMNGEVKQNLPFNSTHRIHSSFGYKPLSDKFHFNMNMHWHGIQQLPNTQSNPEAFQRPDISAAYTILNAQVTYNIKQFEIYLGCENIFNFRQNRPIISWQDPFSPYFDTSSVWGPTRGRETYVGLRYRLSK